MTKSSAVLLDIDGTLLDSTYHHALAWHRAFSRLVEAPPLWRVHRAIGMGGDRLVAAVADDRTEADHGDALRDAWREEYAAIRSEVRPLPGAADLVHRLADDGITVAVASSGDPEFSREAVDLLGVGKDIAVLLTSEDVDSSKPEPDLIEQTLDRLGGPTDAIFVGDTAYDVEAAARAELPCIAVRSGGWSTAELQDAGAVRVEDGPTDLIDVDWAALLDADGPS